MTTTETTAPEAPATPTTTTTISLDMLRDKANVISQIDSQITAASGNDAQARKAVVDEIITTNKGQLDQVVARILDQFKTQLSGDLLVGVMARLEDAMKGDLKEMADKVIDEKVKTNAGEQVDVTALKERRKAELEAFRALRTILESLSIKTETVEEPKRAGGGRTAGSGGGSAKTGMNKENYRYLMDGKGRPASQNTFSSFAFYVTKGLDETGTPVYKVGADGQPTTELNKDENMSSKAFRSYLEKALAEQNPPASFGAPGSGSDSWEVTLPNGVVAGARRLDPTLDEKDGFVFPTTEQSAETPAPAEGAAPSAEPAPATA